MSDPEARDGALDRATILEAVLPTLLATSPDPDTDPEAVGMARIVAEAPAIVAGLPVVKEVFGRLGVRTRPVLAEGSQAAAGDVVAEVGGALAAIRGAAPVALTWLQRLSGVATGAVAPEPGAPLDDHAARLSRAAAVGEADPSFRPSGPPAFRPSFRMEFVD